MSTDNSYPRPVKSVKSVAKKSGPAPAWLLAVLLALITVALYWPATRCDFVNLDDPDFVTANVQVQKGLTAESVIWACLNPVNGTWHPLTMWSHMLDCQLFGVNPWAHHLTSLLLHAVNTALVFLLLRGLTGSRWRSALVAALFGWHPLHVESVAWIAERKDVLSGFFGLLALMAYARYAWKVEGRRQKAESTARLAVPGSAFDVRRSMFDVRASFHLRSPIFYLLSLFFLALGLMSKPMLVTWPFIMLLLDYWPLGRMQNVGTSATQRASRPTLHGSGITHPVSRFTPHVSRLLPLVLEKLPFFALSALGSLVTFVTQQQGGAVASGAGSPALGARVGNALVAYCLYLAKLFWPANLAVFYPHPGHWPLVEVLLAGGLLLGISVLLFVQQRRYPFLLMGWLWFVGMLVPVIGLVQVGEQAMADRYTYLPALGVLILVVWGGCALTRGGRFQVLALRVAAGAALVLCLVLTRRQIGYWVDSETLFRHTLAVTKDNWLAHNNLGTALEERGDLDEAIGQYQETVRLAPASANGYNNLGTALAKRGQLVEGIRQLQEAVRLSPASAEVHNNLGNALLAKGELDSAINQLQEALRLNPNYPLAHFNLGVACMNKGQTDEAIHQYQEALRLNPGYAEAHNNLGITLAGKGQFDPAIDQFQQALNLNPDYADARKNLAIALAGRARASQGPGTSTNR